MRDMAMTLKDGSRVGGWNMCGGTASSGVALHSRLMQDPKMTSSAHSEMVSTFLSLRIDEREGAQLGAPRDDEGRINPGRGVR
jgi:hypothetical protein